jgi:hypothetical protein
MPVSYYNGLQLLDTNARILQVTYKGGGVVQTPNSRAAKWLISSAFNQTEMYIFTTSRVDTLVVESRNSYQYENDACGNALQFSKSTPAIIYHTFDTAYILESQVSSYTYENIQADTIYFRLK